jgi:aminotransferase
LSSKEFSVRLLGEQKVAVVPGTAFGPSGEGYLRCCFATAMDRIQLAVERTAKFLKDL